MIPPTLKPKMREAQAFLTRLSTSPRLTPSVAMIIKIGGTILSGEGVSLQEVARLWEQPLISQLR
jgi:hypothetical protein